MDAMTTTTSIIVKRLHALDDAGTLKAFADVHIDEMWLVRGLRVVAGSSGLFVGMPSGRGRDGKYYETVRSLTSEAKVALETAVLEAYHNQSSTQQP